MNGECEIVRDLLPLYADGIASGTSARLVEEHIAGCGECAGLLEQMKNTELEQRVGEETADVLTNRARQFKRKSAIAGGIIAGIFMIPVVVCLIVNLAQGHGPDWFFIVLAAVLTAASLTVVPLVLTENRGLWTLAAFSVTLVLLFGVCCLYSGGRWFFVASTATLFGLSLVFLPFAVRSKALSGLLKERKGIAVMAMDTLLYGLMMLAVGMYVRKPDFCTVAAAFSLPCLLFAWLVILTVRYLGRSRLLKTGVCLSLTGLFLFFFDAMVNGLMRNPVRMPVFKPMLWNGETFYGNVSWLILIGLLVIGAVLAVIGRMKERKMK